MLYLFSASGSREFLKLPLLVEHYFDHAAEKEGRPGSFITYLVQHYSTEDGTDQDAAEDNQLPFKSPENTLASFVSLKPPQFLLTGFVEIIPRNSFPCHRQDVLPSRYLDAIWQPPRC